MRHPLSCELTGIMAYYLSNERNKDVVEERHIGDISSIYVNANKSFLRVLSHWLLLSGIRIQMIIAVRMMRGSKISSFPKEPILIKNERLRF